MKSVSVGGRDWEIRPLKRGEAKALRKDGLNLASLDQQNYDEAVDRVFDLVLPGREADLDELTKPEEGRLFRHILALTFGRDEDAEKNSSPSGPGETGEASTAV